MSGGLWEATTGYIANGHQWLSIWNNSYAVTTANNNTNQISTKYATAYKHNETYDRVGIDITPENREIAAKNNRFGNINIYGDAIVETSSDNWGQTSWQGDLSYFASLDLLGILRGGTRVDTITGGVFAFFGDVGAPDYDVGSRAVVIAL